MRETLKGLGAVLLVFVLLHCVQGSNTPTIKSAFDLGVALCEITLREDPSLVPAGQTLETICRDATFAQPFVDEILTGKRHALLRMRPARPSPADNPPLDSVPSKD